MFGIVSNIQRFSVHDGPGIRTTVFLQGCPLNCWWCHNPENIPIEKFSSSEDDKLINSDKLIQELKKDLIFMEESGGGITFSGGEPFCQPVFLKKMLELCKEEGIHTAIDTSGFINSEIFSSFFDITDVFLYDMKLINDEKHLKYTGVSNKLILQNLNLLHQKNIKLIIRIPLIPQITDTKENINEIISHLSKMANIKKINLLPFHRIAEGKYDRLGINNKMKNTLPQTEEKINLIKNQFTNAGFDVGIGG